MADERYWLDRRSFLGTAAIAAAGVGATSFSMRAQGEATSSGPAAQHRPLPLSGGSFSPLRAEIDIRDCVVDGKIPSDLNGGFYATIAAAMRAPSAMLRRTKPAGR
jgi:hypothetical protein